MHARKMVRKGFTLVEILIVVVILGILAAIVIPQFTNASEAAKASSVLSQLQTLRSQVELYKNQHNNEYPTADGTLSGAWDWTKMTSKTDIDGAVGTTAGTHIYGPYMQQAPKNPFVATAATTEFGTAVDGTDGWVVNTTTGVIRAAVPTATASEQNMDTTNDVVAY
ncbi:MAG: type II secretion system protein [Phycisphaeraceae bacterium]|jgi:general secretion pathway protein G